VFHNPLEVERRLTEHQAQLSRHEEMHEASSEDRRSIRARMSVIEKAILAIGAVLQVLMQDKWPALAELARNFLK